MSARRKGDGAERPRIGEAQVAYEPQSVAQVFWIAFQSLSKDQQGAFLTKLLDDPQWYEEIADAIAVIEAENEPTIPYEEFQEQLRREGRL